MAKYDKNALKAEIVRNGLNMEQIGEHLGVTRPTVYRRFNNGSWSLDDVKALMKILHLSGKDVNRIFFA